MRFTETRIAGVYVLEVERKEDLRGYFAEVFRRDEFKRQGLVDDFPQHNLGFNLREGTLRGMHFQRDPHWETKVVRCTRGAAFDVALDLRVESATFMRWVAVELSAANHRMLYIPKGCAHGYQALVDDTEVDYLISQYYVAQSATGVRYNDPAFAIEWPLAVTCISGADAAWPDFHPSTRR